MSYELDNVQIKDVKSGVVVRIQGFENIAGHGLCQVENVGSLITRVNFTPYSNNYRLVVSNERNVQIVAYPLDMMFD